MKQLFKLLIESITIPFKSKKLFLSTFIPSLVLILLYVIFAKYLIIDIPNFINSYISTNWGWVNGTISIVVWTVFIFLFIFIFNLSFIVLLSIVSIPFHDIVTKSILTDNKIKEIPLFQLIKQELIKGFIIITLTTLSFMLSLIPLLIPIVLIFSSALLAFNFLDYSYSNQGINGKYALKEYFRDFFVNTFFGFLFLILLSIPFFNIIIYPYVIIVFTKLSIRHK